jgi:hypothetical protein
VEEAEEEGPARTEGLELAHEGLVADGDDFDGHAFPPLLAQQL